MGTEGRVAKCHILALPCPFQGHINPMLQLCKRLASRGIKITFLVASPDVSVQNESKLIKIESIPDESLSDMANLKTSVLKHLPLVLENKANSGEPVKVILYDALMPWALDVAHQSGIHGAALFTQSAAVVAVYYHLYKGTLKLPLEGPVSLPCLPLFQPNELPSYVYCSGTDDPVTLMSFLPFLPSFMYDMELNSMFLKGTLEMNYSFGKADWLLFNTYESLEEEVVSWMKQLYPIKTIGPCVPPMYLDKTPKDDNDVGLGLFNPNTEECIKWLDSKANGTVVYASFGSLTSVGEEQMEEAAEGLANGNYPFLWIVRKSEQSKLPSNFKSETQEKGLISSWCPQLDVLAHPAVGCFVTHCGWNSTLEALSLGVPTVVIPQWTDQPTNAKFIVDVWETGVRAKTNGKGIVTKEELETCIKQVLRGESAEKFKKNATRLKELAKEAMSQGGSSHKDIQELVTSFLCA